jgi:Tol biopolymer transport system component
LWVTGAIASLAIVAVAVLFVRDVNRPMPPEMRLQVVTPPTEDPTSMAISPDGRQLVFAATANGKTQLWLRSLEAVVSQPIGGTESASQPFWSPNSRRLGFVAEGKLKWVDASGGAVQTFAVAEDVRGATWSSNDTILFATRAGPIYRVTAAGGDRVAVTRLTRGQTAHRSPYFLPDGRHFLFVALGSAETRGAYVTSLDTTTEPRRLFDTDFDVIYAPPGFLLFVRKGMFWAQRFDLSRLTLVGDPTPVADRAQVDGISKAAAISAAASGILVYRAGAGAGSRQLIWTDRTGKLVGEVAGPDETWTGLSMSRDGSHVAVGRVVDGNQDIWLLETRRGLPKRLTVNPTIDMAAVWSPNGRQVVFTSDRTGNIDLYEASTTEPGTDTLFFSSSQSTTATDWSPDGRVVLYTSGGNAIWALPVEGRRPSIVRQRAGFIERDGRFSPDGHWIAYVSNESGRYEVSVQPFPGPGESVQVSTTGGVQPHWRADGRELFFLAPDGRLMAAPMTTTPNGQSLEPGQPSALFTPRIVGGPNITATGNQYVVARDGQHFLINTIVGDTSPPVVVVLNWAAASKK